MIMLGNNDKIINSISLEECMEACLKETEFFCKSFDYDRSRNCNLSSKKQHEDGVRMFPVWSSSYYERDEEE